MEHDLQSEREALDRILGSDLFRDAPKVRQLLNLLCKHRWSESEDRLTQYVLAEHLYGDVEEVHRARQCVGTLRRNLAAYYGDTGRGDTLRLSVPKGRYEIQVTSHAAPAETTSAAVPVPEKKIHTSRSALLLASGSVVALMVLAAAAWGLTPLLEPEELLRVEFRDRSIRVLDERENLVRSISSPWKIASQSGDFYRFRMVREDLNGDGHFDLVFSTDKADGTGGSRLHIIYGPRAEPHHVWSMERPLEGEEDPLQMSTQGVDVLHDEEGRPVSVLVGLAHVHGSLGYIHIRKLDGQDQGVYWTWGQPSAAVLERDLDGDGDLEVLIGIRDDVGPETSPGRGAGVLALDPTRLSGYLPHDETAKLFPPDAAPGTHIAYVLFPPTVMTFGNYRNHVENITIIEEGKDRIQVFVSEGADPPLRGTIWYRLDDSLMVVDIHFVQNMQKLHWECLQKGIDVPPLDDAFKETLKNRVLYHDGSAWNIGASKP